MSRSACSDLVVADAVVGTEVLVGLLSQPRVIDTRQPAVPLDKFIGGGSPPKERLSGLDGVWRDMGGRWIRTNVGPTGVYCAHSASSGLVRPTASSLRWLPLTRCVQP
jgi:hypothetical protein